MAEASGDQLDWEAELAALEREAEAAAAAGANSTAIQSSGNADGATDQQHTANTSSDTAASAAPVTYDYSAAVYSSAPQYHSEAPVYDNGTYADYEPETPARPSHTSAASVQPAYSGAPVVYEQDDEEEDQRRIASGVHTPNYAKAQASDLSALQAARANAVPYQVKDIHADAKDKFGKPKKYLRAAGGEIWEDMTLDEWPENDFRIFCGDLGNECNDNTLANAFKKYTSFAKAKVVREKRSGKSKGYGFASFLDPADCARALKEMDGKYVGNRPIKLRKSTWQERDITVARKKKKIIKVK